MDGGRVIAAVLLGLMVAGLFVGPIVLAALRLKRSDGRRPREPGADRPHENQSNPGSLRS